MPLHPQAEAVLKDVPRVWTDLESMTVAQMRSWDAALFAEADARLPSGIAVEDVAVSGAAGELHGRVYRPSAAPAVGTVLWLHGGGFVAGSLKTEPIPAPLALAAGCTVVSIDYRLAPEHPFPAGLEDCYAALRWLAERAPALGGDSDRVVIAGESAGGNLAAAVALMARDRRGPQIALQLLLVPATARAFDGPSRHDSSLSIWPPEALEWIWQQYLGGQDGSDPLASPLNAETLAGLPPAVVITAEYDLLRDEGEAYAERLRRDGVAVELRRYHGMHHSFAASHSVIDAGAECITYMGAAVRQAFCSST